MSNQTDAIQAILTDVDDRLRKRLAEIGAKDLAHIVVAVMPDGAAIVRGNVGPEGLKALAQDLSEAADEVLRRPPDDEPVH